jgi:hypothetical protein
METPDEQKLNAIVIGLFRASAFRLESSSTSLLRDGSSERAGPAVRYRRGHNEHAFRG